MYVAVREMRWGGTIAFLGFDFVTFGLFSAWYLRRQTQRLDDQLGAGDRVPQAFLWFAIVTTVLAAPARILYLLPFGMWPSVPEWAAVPVLHGGTAAWLAMVPWAFAVRAHASFARRPQGRCHLVQCFLDLLLRTPSSQLQAQQHRCPHAQRSCLGSCRRDRSGLGWARFCRCSHAH